MTNNHTATLQVWPGDCNAAISLCYDAGYQSQVDSALPDLEEARIRSTFLLDGELYLKNHSSWKGAYKFGHEFGNGALLPWSSESGELTNWSVATALNEVHQTDLLLKEAFDISNPILGLPRGIASCSDGSLIEATAGRYRRMPTESQSQSMIQEDIFPIFCYGLDFDELKGVVANLARLGKWGVLCFGDTLEFDIGNPVTPTSPKVHHLFTKWLATQKGLWLAPVSDVKAYVSAMATNSIELSQHETVLEH